MSNDLTIYNQYAPIMDTGDGLLYVGEATISRVIQWWVHTFFIPKKDKEKPIFNHGNLVLRLAEYEGKTDRRWCLDARSSGAYPVLLSRYLEEYDGHCWWYPLKDQYNPQRIAIGCAAAEMAGTPYDFGGLVKNALGQVSAEARKVFCTESMFIAYRDGGKIIIGDKVPRPDQVPLLTGWDGKCIFEKPIKLF
jgi:hypothetical protein